MENRLDPQKTVYLTVFSPGIIRDTLHGCSDERNQLRDSPFNQGPEERALQTMGPCSLLATVMLMKEAQGVNGEASLLPVC